MNTYRITRETRSEADFANVVTVHAARTVYAPSIGSTFAKSAPVRAARKPRGFFARLLGL